MGVLDILKGGTIKAVEGIVDSVITNPEEKMQAKSKLSSVVLEALTEISKIQGDVIKEEMRGNFLQKSWRPILMLTFGVILVSKWFGFTDTSIDVRLEMELLQIVKLGIGGYVIGRSAEKIASNVTKNIDMPFLRRKDRQ